MYRIFLVAITSLLISCSANSFSTELLKVDSGMSKAEVIEAMGPPSSASATVDSLGHKIKSMGLVGDIDFYYCWNHSTL